MVNVKPIVFSEPDVKEIDKRLKGHLSIEIDGNNVPISAKDLKVVEELGRGRYGKVLKCHQEAYNFDVAVKMINYDQNDKVYERELVVGTKAIDCKYLITSYGALVYEGEFWLLLPLMDLSLDKLLNKVVEKKNKFPFKVLAFIAFGTCTGLEKLHKHKIIHRDVKPSNLLVNKQGELKICDYGISGQLVNSIANTNVGSDQYLAPERIDSQGSIGFNIKSDVWSLGLSILELAILKYPYPTNLDVFERINVVVTGPAPTLTAESGYPNTLKEFIDRCLQKNSDDRYSYIQLLGLEIFKQIDENECSKLLSDFVIQHTN